jgi:ABC-type cobalamin/Fe3+-siderophores transport system ATPase subunit
MVIVAGIGLLRPADLDSVAKTVQEKVAPYSNCAVVIAPGVIGLVSKKHPSEGEALEVGGGPRVFDVTLHGRMIRLGVAICMDYIHIGHTFDPEGSQIDVVAIPALSRNTEVFAPDQPRDFVRVISNHSCYGGTRILLPSPSGAAFVTNVGTDPFLSREEGVMVADFDKYQTAPRSTYSSRNRVAFRTSLVASPNESDRVMIETIQHLPLELQPGSEPSLMVDSWIERTRDEDQLLGLQECLITYKQLSTSGVLTENDRLLLTTHLLVPDAKPAKALRAAQADQVSATLRRLVSEDSPPTIFEAQREYAALRESLRPARKQQVPRAEAQRANQTYFAVGLSRYDSDEAQRTSPYQLDLLRAFSLSFDKDTTLNYRLTTKELAETQDKSAVFEIILGGLAAKDAVLKQTEQYSRAYRAILLSGWSCYSSDAEIITTRSHVYAIEPVEDDRTSAPAIRADWGGVVDVLRAQPQTMVLDLTCSPLSEASPTARQTSVLPHEKTINAPPPSARDLATEAFGEFLSAQAVEHASDPPSLELRILLSSEYQVSRSLLITIGSMLLGHARFRVKALIEGGQAVPHTAESLGFTVRPDEALRIVHPPHGHIEGRGLRGRDDLRLLAKAGPLTQAGCVLGRGVSARAYVDTPFDLAVDEESRLRHVYVIGKTGSGKTNLLKNMVRQDIANGTGVVVIDPHGDLAEYALGHCAARSQDCLYLDFADRDHLPILNPLSLDVSTETERRLAVDELLDVFTKRTYHEWYGPRFEDTVRMALDTLRFRSPGAPCSILDVPGLLRNATALKGVLASLPPDSDLHARWKIFNRMKDTEQAEVINWVLAKFNELEQSEVLRFVLVARESSFSLAEVVAGRKILIVRLPEAEIGTRAASFLGSLLVARIARHIVQRHAGVNESGRRNPLFMYVDEFQKFMGSGFDTLLPEARKFGLGLVLAHQNTDQLRAFSRFEGARDSSVLTQILGNVGTIVCFRIGSRDAELIAPELGLKPNNLLRIGRYDAVARVVANGSEQEPVTVAVYDSAAEPGFPETRERVRRLLRERGVLVATLPPRATSSQRMNPPAQTLPRHRSLEFRRRRGKPLQSPLPLSGRALLTRAALITCGRAKKQFLMCSLRSLICLQV